MLQNAYLVAKIGADTAENEQHFAEILPTDALWRGRGGYGRGGPEAARRQSGLRAQARALHGFRSGRTAAISEDSDFLHPVPPNSDKVIGRFMTFFPTLVTPNLAVSNRGS